ncbi:hypothetical protein EI94DRAFT_1697620 [Lactarius quietus]|nr:hypothetical protein EI94DRAFT_1697620 [Lactarius quietus]
MTSVVSRNKVKLQTYQQEYAWRKRAPGRRKISKAERVLLEVQQVQNLHLMEMEDLPVHPRAAFDQAHACELIVHSQEVDPQHTPDMVRDEEQAREYFGETKDILQLFCLCGWMDQFHKHVEDFIQEKIGEAERIMAVPQKEENDYVCLHGLQCLVAGAVQEVELVRQHEYAILA